MFYTHWKSIYSCIYYISITEIYRGAERSDLGQKWVRYASKWTDPGLSQIKLCNTIWYIKCICYEGVAPFTHFLVLWICTLYHVFTSSWIYFWLFILFTLWEGHVDSSNPLQPNICVREWILGWRWFEESTRPSHKVSK